jgi:TfoX/Sxy family transcriptional regulator of competence genes
MAYSERLAQRVREFFAAKNIEFEEKKMFSGICFMVNDKMCAGVQKDQLMLRIDPSLVEPAAEQEGCTPMDMNGKIMKSFLLVEESALARKTKLEYWLQLALDFNPLAKSSKKKT